MGSDWTEKHLSRMFALPVMFRRGYYVNRQPTISYLTI